MNMETIVLLVDDDKYLLSALQRILSRHGSGNWKILTAENALDGLELLVRHPVALVVSDMCMPGMDGLQLLEEASRIRPHAIRVMLTADPSLRTARAAINRCEVFRYLSKPWNNEDIMQVIKDGVDRYRSEVERKVIQREMIRENVELKNKCNLMSGFGAEH